MSWKSALLVLALALFVALAAAANHGVDDVFTDEDAKALKAVAVKALKHAGSSLEDTFDGVNALTEGLGEKLDNKDEVCSSALKALKSEKLSLEDTFYAIEVTEDLKCGETPSKAISAVLNKGVNSASLIDIFHAVRALYNLKLHAHLPSDVDTAGLKTVASRLAALVDRDGEFKSATGASAATASELNAGYAFQTLAFVSSLVDVAKDDADAKAVAAEVVTLFESEAEEDSKSAAHAFDDDVESPLETTLAVLEGVDALQRARGSALGVTAELLAPFAQTFLNRKGAGSVSDAHAVAVGLKLIAHNAHAKVLAATVAQKTLKDNQPARLKVTSVLNEPVGKLKVQLAKVAASGSDEAIVSKQDLTAEDSKGTVFAYNFLEKNKPDAGVYTFDYTVSSDDTHVGTVEVSRKFAVVAAVTVSDAELLLTETKNAEDDSSPKKVSLDFGKKASAVVKADRPYLQLSLKVKGVSSGRAQSVQQVFLRLSHSKSDKDAVLVLVNGPKGYRVSTDVASAIGSQVDHLSGVYKAELLLGDAVVSNPTAWHFADIEFSFPKQNVTERDPLLAPRKPIAHLFRPADVRANTSTALLATALVLAPWAILLIGLLVVGINLGRMPSGINAIFALLFVASIGAILFLLYVYWLRLNMFQTLGYLSVLGVFAILFGSRTLSAIASESKAHQD